MNNIIKNSNLSFFENIIAPKDLFMIYNLFHKENISLKNIQTYQSFRNASIFLISRLYKIIFQLIDMLPENINSTNYNSIDREIIDLYLIIQTLIELKCPQIINKIFSNTDDISTKNANFLDYRLGQTNFECKIKHQQFGLLNNPDFKITPNRGGNSRETIDFFMKKYFGSLLHYWKCDNFLHVYKNNFVSDKDYILIDIGNIDVNNIYINLDNIKNIKNKNGEKYMLCGLLYGCPEWPGSSRRHEIFSQCDDFTKCNLKNHTFHDDQIIHTDFLENYDSIKKNLQWGCRDFKPVQIQFILYEKIIELNKLYEFVKIAPKTELHIHLEALVPPTYLIEQKIIDSLELKPNLFDMFNAYVEKMKYYILKDVNKEENFKYLMRKVFEYMFEDRIKQNITYTQFQYSGLKMYGINYNPYNKPETGITMLTQANIITDILDELKQIEKNKSIYIDFIMDIPRGQFSEFKTYNIEKYIEDIKNILNNPKLNRYFKGIGLGGRAEDVTFNSLKKYFTKIRLNKPQFGIINPHAGEFDKSGTNIVETIDFIPERIGHGIQIMTYDSLSNPLIQKSKNNNISYDVCITSNIHFIKTLNENKLNYKNHPIYDMIKNGLDVNLSTDDPILLGKNLNEPLTLIQEYNNFIDNCPNDWTLDTIIIETFLLIKRGWLSKGVDKIQSDKNIILLNELFSKYFPSINIEKEQKFRQKYLKYKQKYLKIKKINNISLNL